MNVPDVIIDGIFGVASAVGLGGFVYLQRRANSNAAAVVRLSQVIDEKLDRQDQDHKVLFKEMMEQVIFVRNCDDKQELWQARFDSMLEANQLQHEQIVSAMSASNKVFENQLKDVLHKLDELEQCVRNIQLKKDC